MTLARLLLAAIVLACFASCASSDTLRQRRIEANTELYGGQSADAQALIAEGSIREGFSKEAVFLSWGRPDDVRKGSRKNVPYETWTYSASQPRTQAHIGLGYGYGYGRYHPYRSRHYYNAPYFGFSPSTTYYQVPVGKVEFLNDRVVSWETR